MIKAVVELTEEVVCDKQMKNIHQIHMEMSSKF